MAGPVAGVLLRRALTGEEAAAFDRWLNEVFTPDRHGDNDRYVRVPAAIGAPDEATEAGPINIVREAWPAGDYDDMTDFIDRIGFRPAELIDLYAGVNGRIDHLVLGRTCLALARRYDGLVDFGGAVDLAGYRPKRGYDTEDVQEIERWLTAIEAAIKTLPGTVYSIPYETARGTPWVSHVGDAEFLAAWLDHPRFHMIK